MVKTATKAKAKSGTKPKTTPKATPKAKAKPAAKRQAPAPTFPRIAPGELLTPFDFVRYAVSRFAEADLSFAHGTTDPIAEAAFLVCDALHLHPDQFETFAT
ncbi:MAG TPA: hypothetical protein VES39_04275, partial [Rhodospirillales bacterium]|nr:hypothetical protein [Rhodospirillales bacterium]